MEKFPSIDEAKMDILTENRDAVFFNMSIAHVLKNFCLNTQEDKLTLPPLDRHPSLMAHFLRLTDSLGMDAVIASDGSLIVTKDSEPSRPRANILMLAPTTTNILAEHVRNCQTEREQSGSTDSQKQLNASLPTCGSRSAGRLNLSGNIPIIGEFLGEEPEAVYARRRLPICKFRFEILKYVDQNVVVMVTGDPGSGKTTQVPQYILEQSGKNQVPCRIVSILPRRISAQAAAERVKYERGVTGERLVGFQTRLESRTNATSQIIFCTTGVFLHTMMSGDGFLSGITHLIIDEVHCRDRYTDLLLGIIRTRLPKFPGMRLILLSANVSCTTLSSYFFKCPIIKITSPIKPNSVLFLEEILTCTKFLVKQEDPPEAFFSDVPTMCDTAIAAAWLSGTEEIFVQLVNWVIDGTMPVDYRHRLNGITLLMAAAIHGRTDIVKCLISHGADPTLKLKGLTPFDIANEFARPEAADLLQTYGEAFQTELGSNIVDATAANVYNMEDGSNAFYSKYSKDHVNLDLVIEVIGFALGYSQPGTILVILPGYSEMVELRDMINSSHLEIKERVQVLVLHSYLQITDYKNLFKPIEESQRKVILATPMVESTVSFDDISCVIDSGLVRDRENDSIIINPRKTSPISKASAQQRSLHCRNGGIVLRLYTRSRYESFQEFTVPEITRVQLTDVCLFARFLLPIQTRLREFFCSLPDSPPTTSVQNAIETLQHIGALDYSQKATPLGMRLVDMPVEPRLGKMILAAVAIRCMDPVLTIVCCLSRDDPFITPACPEQRKAAIARKIELGCDALSDHLALLKAYHFWETASEARKRQVCFENFLSAADLELIFLLRVQLVGELRACGYIRTKGSCDIRSLNVHSESWTAIKAALTTGLYPNVARYSLASGGVVTRTDTRAQFHYTSTLLSQESKMQPFGVDSYFGPPYTATGGLNQTNFRSGLLNCPWLIYQEQEKKGECGVLRCSSIVTPVTAILCTGHANLPTIQLLAVEKDEERRLSDMYESHGGPRDNLSEEGIRSVCEELNLTHLTDRVVAYHQKMRNTQERIRAQNMKQSSTIKIDEFLLFKTEENVAKSLVILRRRFQTLLEKCMCEPGYSMTPVEEGVLKTVLQVLSSEDTALRLPQPTCGIGRRPTNVSADSILVAPDLKPEELCLIKRYETYCHPPRGQRRGPKRSIDSYNIFTIETSDSHGCKNAQVSREDKMVTEAMSTMSLGNQGRPICKSYPPRTSTMQM